MKNKRIDNVKFNFEEFCFINLNLKDHPYNSKFSDKPVSDYLKKKNKLPNFYSLNNYYKNRGNFEIDFDIDNIKVDDIGFQYVYSHYDYGHQKTKIKAFHIQNKFRQCKVTIVGNFEYILRQMNEVLNFERKDKFIKAVKNYSIFVSKSFKDKKYECPELVGTCEINFHLKDKAWVLGSIVINDLMNDRSDNKKVRKNDDDLMSYGSFNIMNLHKYFMSIGLNTKYYNNISEDIGEKQYTRKTFIDGYTNKITSERLDELENHFEHNINLYDYLYNDDIDEAVSFIEIYQY